MSGMMRVTGAWTGLLDDWIKQQGVSEARLQAALSRWAGEESVPVPVWRELLARGLRFAAGDPAPELAVGALVKPRHIGVLGYLVMASETLGEAMLTYQRYEKLFYGVNLAEVRSVGKGQVELRWPPSDPPLGQQADGLAIAALVTFLRRQLAAPPPPSEVAFIHPLEPGSRRAYERFFGCRVVDRDSHVRLRFPLSYLQTPMPRRDPILRELLDQQARALMEVLPAESDMEAALHRLLPRLLQEGNPTVQEAASALHVSVRTLQRRLKARGLTWQQWLDRARGQLAIRYLADPALTLSEISLLLGYSEQSAFTRAYRRWTGRSPGADRSRYSTPLATTPSSFIPLP